MKRKIIGLMVFLLVIQISFAIEIDEKVLEELEEKGEVEIIVQQSEDLISKVENSIDKKEFGLIKGYSAIVDTEDLQEILNDSSIKKISYNKLFRASLTDSINIVNASVVHPIQISGVNLTGYGESICIIDTGVDYNNPSLGGCFGAGCKVVDGYDFVNGDNDPMDDYGHGTHCAGILSASGNVIGIAPDSKILAVKALDNEGNGYETDVLSGFEWCINHSEQYNVSAISMSFGTEAPYLFEDYCDVEDNEATALINLAVSKNISVIAASGNDGNNTAISLPACIKNVTSVGATDKNDDITDYSNLASILDLLAPGSEIDSTCLGIGSCEASGTSMATPHVAAAIAILKQFEKIQNSNHDLTNVLRLTGMNISNWNRIDIYSALAYIDEAPQVDGYKSPEEVFVYDNVTFVPQINDTTEIRTYLFGSNYTGNWENYTFVNNYTLNNSYLESRKKIGWYFSAEDVFGKWNNSELKTFVVGNHKPNITSYNPENLSLEISENTTLDFNITVTDYDNDTLYYNWLLDGVVIGNETELNYYFDFESAGLRNLTLGVSDGELTDKIEWDVLITNTNVGPNLTQEIPEISWTENNIKIVDLTNYFNDLDKDNLTYVASGVDNITITFNNSKMYLDPELNWFGTRYLIITASDSEYSVESNNITLKVIEYVAPVVVNSGSGSGGSGGGNKKTNIELPDEPIPEFHASTETENKIEEQQNKQETVNEPVDPNQITGNFFINNKESCIGIGITSIIILGGLGLYFFRTTKV